VLGDRADHVHVGGRRARVLAGDVAPAQAVDEASERLHEHAAVGDRTLRVGPDDRLAAAVRQPGERGLVGHAAREAHDVHDRFVARLVRVHARAADGGTQARVVDGHGGAQVRLLVVQHMHFARAHLRRDLEYAHQDLPLSGQSAHYLSDLGCRSQGKCSINTLYWRRDASAVLTRIGNVTRHFCTFQ
jgi:hypothetical protein